jgi:phytoene/squalene synthetase
MAEKIYWGEHSIGADEIILAGYDTRKNIAEAESWCSEIADAHYENFVVTNWFTPDSMKQHIHNIYAFCRYGDDLGDDAPFDDEGRWNLLNAWEEDLERAAENDWTGEPRHPILLAIQRTAREKNIPKGPFCA